MAAFKIDARKFSRESSVIQLLCNVTNWLYRLLKLPWFGLTSTSVCIKGSYPVILIRFKRQHNRICQIAARIIVFRHFWWVCLVFASVHIPSSWCAPTCVRVLGESTDVGTLYRLSQASPDRSAQCSPPYGNHLNTRIHTHVKFFGNTRSVGVWEESRKGLFTHTCWADEQSSPCCCV